MLGVVSHETTSTVGADVGDNVEFVGACVGHDVGFVGASVPVGAEVGGVGDGVGAGTPNARKPQIVRCCVVVC